MLRVIESMVDTTTRISQLTSDFKVVITKPTSSQIQKKVLGSKLSSTRLQTEAGQMLRSESSHTLIHIARDSSTQLSEKTLHSLRFQEQHSDIGAMSLSQKPSSTLWEFMLKVIKSMVNLISKISHQLLRFKVATTSITESPTLTKELGKQMFWMTGQHVNQPTFQLDHSPTLMLTVSWRSILSLEQMLKKSFLLELRRSLIRPITTSQEYWDLLWESMHKVTRSTAKDTIKTIQLRLLFAVATTKLRQSLILAKRPLLKTS